MKNCIFQTGTFAVQIVKLLEAMKPLHPTRLREASAPGKSPYTGTQKHKFIYVQLKFMIFKRKEQV